jgi:hypothetical protein
VGWLSCKADGRRDWLRWGGRDAVWVAAGLFLRYLELRTPASRSCSDVVERQR